MVRWSRLLPSSVECKAASEKRSRCGIFGNTDWCWGLRLDGFLKNGDTELRVYTNKITDRRKTAACPEFYVWNRQTYGKPCLAFHLLPGSELTVLMDFSAETESDGMAAIQTKVYAEEGAVLHLVQVGSGYRATGFTFYNDIGTKCRPENGACGDNTAGAWRKEHIPWKQDCAGGREQCVVVRCWLSCRGK